MKWGSQTVERLPLGFTLSPSSSDSESSAPDKVLAGELLVELHSVLFISIFFFLLDSILAEFSGILQRDGNVKYYSHAAYNHRQNSLTIDIIVWIAESFIQFMGLH